jgi:nucleotide-binding universal stress UspA family protein
MFAKILVPLDGSDLAEHALTAAFDLARRFNSLIILLRVVIPEALLVSLPDLPAYRLPANTVVAVEADAIAYLEGLKRQWAPTGVQIQTLVLSGTPPELIVATAKEQAVDLIVMSTHGRSGFSRLIYGSVAEAVLRGVKVPLLLMPNPAQS